MVLQCWEGLIWEGGTVCLFKQVTYLVGHHSLLGGVSSSPLLGTARERFNNMNSGLKHRKTNESDLRDILTKTHDISYILKTAT